MSGPEATGVGGAGSVIRPVDCVIAGAQKAGTTSLLRYLAGHPSVVAHPHQEMAYFVDEGEFEVGYEAAHRRYFGHAEPGPGDRLVAKSAALLARPRALRRVAEHNPEVVVVALLRDPVERFFSSWRLEADRGRDPLGFEDVIEAVLVGDGGWRRAVYLEQGDYARHLETLRRILPRATVLAFRTEDLAGDPAAVVEGVLRALGLEGSEEVDLVGRHNETRRIRSPLIPRAIRLVQGSRARGLGWVKDRLPQEWIVGVRRTLEEMAGGGREPSRVTGAARARLLEHYEPGIRRLEELQGWDLREWRRPGGSA